jgi:hypothetical protein
MLEEAKETGLMGDETIVRGVAFLRAQLLKDKGTFGVEFVRRCHETRFLDWT